MDVSLPEPEPREVAPRGARQRRRPGRFRRWVLRPLFWGLAALAVLIFVAQLLLDTRWAREGGRKLLSEQLTERLGREVAIGEISYELLPLSVEVWGFSIGGPEPDDPPFLELPFVQVDADLDALWQRRLHLRQVRVERPTIYLEYFPDGTNNLLKSNRKKKKVRRPRRFEVFIDRVEIEKATFGLDQRSVEMSIAASSVQTRLSGRGEMRLGGQLAAQEVTIRLPGARAISVAVSADASIDPRGLEIESARITHPGLTVSGGGSCTWPREEPQNKKCFFQTSGSTETALLEDLGYFDALSGRVSFEGSLGWRPGTTGWRSYVRAQDLVIWDRRIRDLAGSVVADRYGMRITVDQAGYADGQVRGEVGFAQQEEGKPWTVDLDFDGVLLDTLLADQGIPTHGCASRLDGRLVYSFPRGASGRGQGRGEVQVLADPEIGGLPMDGAFPLRIEDGVVRSDSISLRSERQSVLAGGWYDLDRLRGAYEYEIASADVGELMPLLSLADETSLWRPSAGEGEIEGTLYLEPGRATTEVRLRLEDVATPTVFARRMNGNMTVTPEGLEPIHLEVGDGEQALLMDGTIPFEITEDTGVALSFNAFAWPMEAVHPWLSIDMPIAGQISGRLAVEIFADRSEGQLGASISPATLDLVSAPPEAALAAAGEPAAAAWSSTLELTELATELTWDAAEIRFQKLDFRAPSGTLSGAGTYDWTTEAIDLELSSAALELGAEPLSRYLPRHDIGGELSIQAELGGRLGEPRLELVLEADGLSLGGRVLGNRPSRARVEWQGGRFAARGRLLDMIAVDGGGRLDRRGADLGFALDGSDLGGLLELLLAEPPSDTGGSFRGTLRIAGAGAQPRVALTLDELDFELRGRRLRGTEPVTLRLGSERWGIDALRLAEPATGTEIHLAGEGGYTAPAPLDLRLESTLATSWLELFDLGVELDGILGLRGAVGGSFEHPTFTGQGELRGAELRFAADFPYRIEDLGGSVRFEPETVLIDRLEGELAGGSVSIEGRAAVPRDGEPLDYRLKVAGRDLRLRYLEGWSVHGDTELTLRSTGDGHAVIGHAHLDRVDYQEDIRIDFEQLMRGFIERRRLEVDPADSLLSTVELNVDVEAPALLVRNNLADFSGRMDLVLRGNLAQPVLYGDVDIDRGGTLLYNGSEYEVGRGRLIFADPYKLDPEVDIVATTRVRDFEVTMAVAGTFDRLETRFSSEPPLPDLEVIQLLASSDAISDTGDPSLRLNQIGEQRSASAASFLYGQAATVVGDRVSDLFGFDKFRIDPLTGSGDNLSRARVTVGKRISKDVFLTYSVDPSSTEEQRLQIEWQVSPGLVLVLTQNGDNSYSADARWESSF